MSLWSFLYAVLAFLSLILVGLTAAVPQTAHNPAELRHLGFGLPFNFVFADKSVVSMETPAEHTFNPWEDLVVEISEGWLFLDWVLAMLVVIGPVWLIRTLWVRGVSRLAEEA